MEVTQIPVAVAAENGARGLQAWIRRGELPLSQRLREAGMFLLIGVVAGGLFLLVPLIHLMGVFILLGAIVFAVKRLRRSEVIVGAGGTCPGCGREGRFYIGFGRRAFGLPAAASCKACGLALTLLSLP